MDFRKLALRGALALGVTLASSYSVFGDSQFGTKTEEYVGKHPLYGRTKVTTEKRNFPPPKFVVSIESDYFNNEQLPFKRHSLIDEDGDEKFDYGVVPYRIPGTNVSMSRTVERGSDEFLDLQRVVRRALDERGKSLKKVVSNK